MHLKNFSIISEDPENARLSPAYDLLSVRLLLSVSEDPEQLALTINGKKNRLGTADFLALARSLDIPEKVARYILNKQINTQETLQCWIAKSFLSKPLKEKFSKLVAAQCALLA